MSAQDYSKLTINYKFAKQLQVDLKIQAIRSVNLVVMYRCVQIDMVEIYDLRCNLTNCCK